MRSGNAFFVLVMGALSACGGSPSEPAPPGAATRGVDAGLPGSPKLPLVPRPPEEPPDDVREAAAKWASIALPPFDDATIEHVREVRARGVAKGNRLDVFAKIGDSTSASTQFLWYFGEKGKYHLGNHTALIPTVETFQTIFTKWNENSFNRQSLACIGGWTAAHPLRPPSALDEELSIVKPAYAVVMFGTNDLEIYSAEEYRANMTKVLDKIEEFGTVVAISTINDRLDFVDAHARVLAYNDVVRDLARTRHLPLVDFYAGMEPLPNHGIAEEGIHPSFPRDNPYGGEDLRDDYLKYGYNFRNLITLQMLDRLRSIP